MGEMHPEDAFIFRLIGAFCMLSQEEADQTGIKALAANEFLKMVERKNSAGWSDMDTYWPGKY